MAQELSPRMQELAEAIRSHTSKVQVALCGFDLWIEVMGSGHAKPRDFVKGGRMATGEEQPETMKVPIMVLGGRIVVSFDPTLPPDGYVLKP